MILISDINIQISRHLIAKIDFRKKNMCIIYKRVDTFIASSKRKYLKFQHKKSTKDINLRDIFAIYNNGSGFEFMGPWHISKTVRFVQNKYHI